MLQEHHVANYGVVKTGDIVYTKITPEDLILMASLKLIKEKMALCQRYMPFTSQNKVPIQNLSRFILSRMPVMNNYMHPLVNKGAKNDMKVSADKCACKGQIVFPDIKEQRTIG